MRGWAVLLCLCCAVAHGAGRPAKKKRPGKAPDAPAQQEPVKPAPASSTVEAPAPKPQSADWDLRYALSVGAGGFWGGGANRGPSVGATFTMTPVFAKRRFSLDVDLNWRMAQFQSPVESYGTLTSTLHAFPLLVAARMRAFEVGKLMLELRGGLGPVFVLHDLSSDFGSGSRRTAVGWEVFVAAQARFPVSQSVEVFAEARAGLGETPVPFVLGRATGVQGLLGGRFSL